MVMTLGPSPLDTLAPTRCVCGYDPHCVCPDTERALRFILGHRRGTHFNDEQREWCLAEIACVEGYRREDFANLDDVSIARGVLDAWTDYARDKGNL